MITNRQLFERRKAALPRGVGNACGIFPQRALNSEIWDVEGKRFIDFASGIAVLNVGHQHPKVKAAVAAQMELYAHTAFQVMPYEPYVVLAEKLNTLAPVAKPAKTILFSTGSEAVENAVKIARSATKRPGVIAFTGGFHGRTMMALALTGKVAPYKTGFGPFPGEVYHVPFPAEYRGITGAQSLEALEFLFKSDIEPSRVAAIILEPILGEGGFYVAPFDFLKQLRSVCDQHGILLIADEVQAGFGRSGRMFAIEHSGVTPDLMTVAKSMGAGLPLSGVIGRAEVMDVPEPGGLGGTYGGNPVACAAGLAVLDIIRDENLLERSQQIGQTLTERFKSWAAKPGLECIGDIRGLGAMIAIELVKDRRTREPDPTLAKAVTARAIENGLILLSCGLYGNALRMLVPLTVQDKVLQEGLELLERSLQESVKSL